MPKDFNIRIPAMRSIRKVELAQDNKKEISEAIAPTLEHLVKEAGIKLTEEQVADLNNAFIARGTITIPPGGPNMSSTVSVEVNSLNYTSKTLTKGIIE